MCYETALKARPRFLGTSDFCQANAALFAAMAVARGERDRNRWPRPIILTTS